VKKTEGKKLTDKQVLMLSRSFALKIRTEDDRIGVSSAAVSTWLVLAPSWHSQIRFQLSHGTEAPTRAKIQLIRRFESSSTSPFSRAIESCC
jgi:hypothetical protein